MQCYCTCPFLLFLKYFFINFSDLEADDYFLHLNCKSHMPKKKKKKNTFGAKYRLWLGGHNRLKMHRRYYIFISLLIDAHNGIQNTLHQNQCLGRLF